MHRFKGYPWPAWADRAVGHWLCQGRTWCNRHCTASNRAAPLRQTRQDRHRLYSEWTKQYGPVFKHRVFFRYVRPAHTR